MEQAIISGIAFNRDEAKISVMGVEDRPGVAYGIVGPIAEANIDVDMIVQNIGASGHTDFSFTVNRSEYKQALDVLAAERGKSFKAREIIGDNRICKVSVVGIGMRSHVGIASKMFKALADEGINIQMISTSEIKISIVIDEKYLELAVRVLHRAFELDHAPRWRRKRRAFCAARIRPIARVVLTGPAVAQPIHNTIEPSRRRGRVVEGTPLLREHTGKNLYPGFESLRLRQYPQKCPSSPVQLRLASP